jgi:hypothetical protein
MQMVQKEGAAESGAETGQHATERPAKNYRDM